MEHEPAVQKVSSSEQSLNLIDSGATVRMTLRSRKVLVSVERRGSPLSNLLGWRASPVDEYVPIYDYVLDERQLTILRESREMARRTGSRLEVIDLTRESLLRRFMARLGRNTMMTIRATWQSALTRRLSETEAIRQRQASDDDRICLQERKVLA